MRMIFSLVGLLIVLVIVGFLVKTQLSAVPQLPAAVAPATSNSVTPANIAEQSKQMQTQVKEQVNEAMKAAADSREKALDNGNADKPAEKTGSAY